MVATFLDHKMGSLSDKDGVVNETGKKQSVYISKTTTLLHVHYTFFISQPSLQVYDLKLTNFTRPLDGVDEHSKEIFFFSKLRYGPFGFNPSQFPQDFTN